MTTVYSPLSGSIWNLDTYSNGTTHVSPTTLGGDKPVDIGGNENSPIFFVSDSTVRSVWIWRRVGVCRVDPSPWNDGVRVFMYRNNNYTDLIGSVGYGHLKNRIAGGGYVFSGNWNRWLYLGSLPNDCNCGCSRGIHIHAQASGGSRATNWVGQWCSVGSTSLWTW